ncbi:hypothetical protein [Baekduia sp.]|uniref:hypothetical protein n=1 Tax=Baekduia sp. TaxID=2600305 RepID=UPI002D7A11E1|nr:hypothetical protein [Baekduia sp.]
MVALVGVIAAGSVGVALANGDEAPSGVQVPGALQAPSPSPIAAVQPQAKAAFKVLRDVAPSVMPADVVAQVGSSGRYGRNAALARKISTPTGDGWVIPGNGYVCIAVNDTGYGWGTSCVPTDFAAEHGLAIGLMDAKGRTKETLVVPDGKTAAEIEGPASTRPTAVTASTKWKRVKIDARGVATARTNAPNSLRVR